MIDDGDALAGMRVLAELAKDGRPFALAEHAGCTGEVFPSLRVLHEPRWASEVEAIGAWDAGLPRLPREVGDAVEYLVTGLHGRQIDRTVLKRMGRVVRGLVRNHEALLEAARQLQDVRPRGDGR